MEPSYKLYGLIHECVVDAGAKTHEILTPDPELVEFIGANPVAPGAPVIDLGCGAGRNAVWLGQQGFHVTAIDVSPHAVQLARALAAYNAGPAAVTRHGGVPPYPETQAFISRVLSRLHQAD